MCLENCLSTSYYQASLMFRKWQTMHSQSSYQPFSLFELMFSKHRSLSQPAHMGREVGHNCPKETESFDSISSPAFTFAESSSSRIGVDYALSIQNLQSKQA